MLVNKGYDLEVIDIRSLKPLDLHTIGNSIKKTHRVLIMEEQKSQASGRRMASFAQVEPPKGAALFQKSCIGCHDMGGNILSPGATLFRRDLERNGLVTEEDIYNITYYGKGRMPGFGEKCTPRGQCTFGPRLEEEEIRQLAEFVKLQAERGWPNVETNAD